MGYLDIKKKQLINLEYSLGVELLRSNRAGSYANTTVIFSNTRKYHGLLVCPVPELDNDNHVILSDIDETVIQRGAEFRLGIHKYPGNTWEPKGHKYAMDFKLEPIPSITYRVGGVKLKKEIILIGNEERILLRYTLLDANSPTTLRVQPFLAFRNVHKVSKENLYANTRYQKIPNGIKTRMYDGYPELFMQVSKKNEFVGSPDWYRNVEYIKDQKRGYEYQEDLFIPGFFEFTIKKGESVTISAGTKQTTAASIAKQFNKEISVRVPRDSFENNLKNAAQQFLVHKNNKTEIMAGFPWFGRWGRDTFISLPGLTLATGNTNECKAVLDTMSDELNGALFPNMGTVESVALNSVDAPLWFFWAIQQYAQKARKHTEVINNYWMKMKDILQGYKEGTSFNIHMSDNGLIWSGEHGTALTWMDAMSTNGPVTPRTGYAVEVNALWYNAIKFGLDVARRAKDKAFIEEWKNVPELVEKSFKQVFWNRERGYLADYANDEKTDWAVRPNQIFAISLPYPVIENAKWKSIIDVVDKELVTAKGLRTLSPKHPDYKGVYSGDQKERDKAYHQGTVWPWLLGHFAEGYLKIYEQSGVSYIKKLYNGFEEEMAQHGLGTISEVYDGDPPHSPCGAISYARSVAEIIRLGELVKNFEKTK
jgi:predicted glycogen debranching enzyme